MPPPGRDEPCREHIRRYLEAPLLADRDRARLGLDLFGEDHWPDVVTAGVPPSLGRALEEWVTQESTPDEEIAAFVGWPVPKVRECR